MNLSKSYRPNSGTVQISLTSDKDSMFITLFMALINIVKAKAGGNTVNDKGVTVESAQEIAMEFLKRRKNTERVEISGVEKKNDIWVIRGTCPIDLEGHPWAERFEVILDTKGKIKSTNFALL